MRLIAMIIKSRDKFTFFFKHTNYEESGFLFSPSFPTLSSLGPNVLRNTLLTDIHNLFSSLTFRDPVSFNFAYFSSGTLI
jgi:hypothetical protein